MKKKATKLLAVVVIAASPGIVTADRASNASNAPRASNDPWEPTRDPWNTPRDLDPDRVRTMLAELEGRIALVTARPREMPSGAPACGNVASRAPRPAECAPRTSGGSMLATAPANDAARATVNASARNATDTARATVNASASNAASGDATTTTSISSLVASALLVASIGDTP